MAGGEEEAGARKAAEAEGEEVVPGDGPDHVEAEPGTSWPAHFLVRGGDGAGVGDKRRRRLGQGLGVGVEAGEGASTLHG